MNSNYTYSSRSANRRTSQTSDNDWLSLLIFYVLPFIIVNCIIFYLFTCRPSFETTVAEETDNFRSVEVTVKMTSLLPVKGFEASMDSVPIEPIKDGKTYTFQVDRNGTLELLATNFNGMMYRSYVPINILDYTPPTVLDAATEDGVLTFRLEDTQSGVDYSSIRATNASNQSVEPISIDQNTATVKFPLRVGSTLNIYVSDMSGNEVQTHITCTLDGVNDISITDENGEALSDVPLSLNESSSQAGAVVNGTATVAP